MGDNSSRAGIGAKDVAPMHALVLYVHGESHSSKNTIKSLRRLLDAECGDAYSLEVVDVKLNPSHVTEEMLVTIPTLIRKSPLPVRRIVGDLTNDLHVLAGLNLVLEAE